jgi:hypothetical protein
MAAMIVIPFTEQIPWRGFAYPPLERRFGPFAASLIVGVAWALFHVQKQSLLGGLRVDVALWTALLMTAGTVVYTWFYRRTGSMLLVVVANAGIYLDNPVQALPASVIPLAVLALGYTVLAFALVRARAPSIAGSAPVSLPSPQSTESRARISRAAPARFPPRQGAIPRRSGSRRRSPAACDR